MVAFVNLVLVHLVLYYSLGIFSLAFIFPIKMFETPAFFGFSSAPTPRCRFFFRALPFISLQSEAIDINFSISNIAFYVEDGVPYEAYEYIGHKGIKTH